MDRRNNFDLIRLLAALQVAVIHCALYFGVSRSAWWIDTLELFPGVPIFFFISGILISQSWERLGDVRRYARNRALRIFPGLVVVTLAAVASVFAVGYLWNDRVRPLQFVAWLIGQMTFVQFFNPDFMRGYGNGVLNGSLATISTELQFYVIAPVLLTVLQVKTRSKKTTNALLGILTLVFLAAHLEFVRRGGQYTERTTMKLLNVSFVPWLYMFLAGMLVQRNRDAVVRFLRNRGAYFFAAYIAVGLAGRHWFNWRISNQIHPVLFVLLAATVVSLAFTKTELSERLLRGNDISYGIYIFHVPIINLMLYKGLKGHWWALPLTMAIATALAILSWTFVERPALNRKSAKSKQQATAA